LAKCSFLYRNGSKMPFCAGYRRLSLCPIRWRG
jgi:hypothetical protein